VLVEDSGKRWRLENAGTLLVEDRVRLAATKSDFAMLSVRAIMNKEFVPYHRHH
jgi:hypothetical protein